MSSNSRAANAILYYYGGGGGGGHNSNMSDDDGCRTGSHRSLYRACSKNAQ
jgi:hypothetical protein